MDTAKHRPLLSGSDEETTGIFRRPNGLIPAGDRPRSLNDAQRDCTERQRAEPQRERRAAKAGERPRERRKSPGESSASDEELRVTSLHASGLGKVAYDAKGDPIFEWRVEVPRRREEDPTIDLLKCLDLEGLRLEEDTDDWERGVDPYDTARFPIRR